jgi:hypothetical protein
MTGGVWSVLDGAGMPAMSDRLAAYAVLVAGCRAFAHDPVARA